MSSMQNRPPRSALVNAGQGGSQNANQTLRPRRVEFPDVGTRAQMTEAVILEETTRLCSELGVVGGVGQVGEVSDETPLESRRRALGTLAAVARARNRMWHREGPARAVPPLPKLRDSLVRATQSS